MSFNGTAFNDDSDEEEKGNGMQHTASAPTMLSSAPPEPRRSSFLARAGEGVIRATSWLLGRNVSSQSFEEPEREESSTSTPPPSAEDEAAAVRRGYTNDRLRQCACHYMQRVNVTMRIGTWNVASEPPPPEGLEKWLLNDVETVETEKDLPDIVVIGLQEVEFGGTALMLETTDASVSWMESITDALHSVARAAGVRCFYKKVTMTQLVGLTLIIVAKSSVMPYVRNVRKSMSRTGAMSMVGNKGAIGVRATIYHKRFLFITAHFAAHKGKIEKRNSNFRDALSQLKFDLDPAADDELDFVLDYTSTRFAGRRCKGQSFTDRLFGRKDHGQKAQDNASMLLASHDYTFFFGDLNYRLSTCSYSAIVDSASHEEYEELLLFDELRKQQSAAGSMYEGFNEDHINFAPTYKYDKGTSTYDTVKRREPAWTDRILFRVLDDSATSCGGSKGLAAVRRGRSNSLDSNTLTPSPTMTEPVVSNTMRCLGYTSVPEICISDHKPVIAHFSLACSLIDRAKANEMMQCIADEMENSVLSPVDSAPAVHRNSQTAVDYTDEFEGF